MLWNISGFDKKKHSDQPVEKPVETVNNTLHIHGRNRELPY